MLHVAMSCTHAHAHMLLSCCMRIGANVEILIDQKRANQLKQAQVVSNLQAQYEVVTRQQQKLAFIRAELAKLDQSLAKNSECEGDMSCDIK